MVTSVHPLNPAREQFQSNSSAAPRDDISNNAPRMEGGSHNFERLERFEFFDRRSDLGLQFSAEEHRRIYIVRQQFCASRDLFRIAKSPRQTESLKQKHLEENS
jgi:hypothetical protein